MKNSEKQHLMGNFAKIALILLLIACVPLVIPVEAQIWGNPLPSGVTPTNLRDGGSIPLPSGVTPDVTIETNAFLSFTPNPIGINQPLLVNIWLLPQTHVSRYLNDFVVTLTRPNGTKVVFRTKSYHGDSTAWFEYVVDQVGTWKIKFEFLGGYFPAGNYTAPTTAPSFVGAGLTFNFKKSCYYTPSSTEERTFVVQEDIVYSWPPSPLPKDYWTRPVSLNNREWWPILGNYPGTGYRGGGSLWETLYGGTNPCWSDRYRFHPWIEAPDTAHVVWKRQGAVAGLIGGPIGQYGVTASPGTPSLIYSGRVYATYTKQGVGSVAACYDLRTGEVYYEKPTAQGGVTPTLISYVPPQMQTLMTGGSPGAEAQYGWSVELLTISNGRLMKVDPWSGALTLNVSISPLTGSGGTFYNQIGGYVLAVRDLGAAAGAERYRLINWTTVGSAANFNDRIISNTTYARSSLPSLIDWNAGLGADVGGTVDNDASGIPRTMIVRGYDLKTGRELWNATYNSPAYNPLCNVADQGKVAILTQDGYFIAYDLRTGRLAWEGEKMCYPWGASSFGDYGIQSAYGMLFYGAYDGYYAFNWTNGKIVWHYKPYARAAFESPYMTENNEMVYPFLAMFNGGLIADGKLYTFNSEHSPSWPRTRGWSLHCINITTGELIWRIDGEHYTGAVADGYLVTANIRDGYTYVFGKGKSQTSVTASPKTVSKGSQVLIEGSVLDMSPAQPGTPCVSKESMATWMEYLHFQYPIDGLWHNETIKGVSVALTAISEDGSSYIDIGTVVTDGYSGTFGVAWTAPEEGTYKIVASFNGDESYGSSSATTWITIGPAPPEPETPEYPTPTDYTPILAALALAIVIVAVLVVYAIVSIRKIMRK